MVCVFFYKVCSKLASFRLIICWLKSCLIFSRARLTIGVNSSVFSWLNVVSRCVSARVSFLGISQSDLLVFISFGILLCRVEIIGISIVIVFISVIGIFFILLFVFVIDGNRKIFASSSIVFILWFGLKFGIFIIFFS